MNSVEPFVTDRSGWTLLKEPVGNDGLFEILELIRGSAERFLGSEKRMSQRPKPNPFVEEMRRRLSKLQLTYPTDGGTKIPQLTIQVSIPQEADNSKRQMLTTALKRGLSEQSILKVVVSSNGARPITSCDEYVLQESERHQPQIPQVIILTHCPVIGSKEANLEISKDAPIIVVRTKHTSLDERGLNALGQLLEIDVAPIISHEIMNTARTNNQRLPSIQIKLIDENPASRSRDNPDRSKLGFESIGAAFAKSVRLLIQPLLNDLSFLYGEDLATPEAITLSTSISAHLPLPDELVEIEDNEDDEEISEKYISTDHLANWANTNMMKHQETNHVDTICWAMFVPSQDHSPLIIHDHSSREEGASVTFSKGALSGLSLINLEPSLYQVDEGNFDLTKMQQHFQNATSSALLYLVGYIRAFHGLSPITNHSDKTTPKLSITYLQSSDPYQLSFWELESIARSRLHSVLQTVLDKTDAFMGLLHTHKRLAFAETTANNLNNATHLLRHSISLLEQDYPLQYTTSSLYKSLYYLESAINDSDLMELPYFAIDHYLAVFSPFILPLTIPLVVGLVREVKRYRKLKMKVVEGGTDR